jgi:predicted MFS family arabinose efflux permease
MSHSQDRTISTGALIVMGVAAMMTVANIYISQPLLPAIAATFGTNPGQAGIVATLSQFGYALGILFIVPLGDRVEPRTLIRVLLLIVASLLVLAAFAPSLPVLAAASLLVAMGTCIPQIVIPLAAGMVAPQRRGQVISIVQLGLISGILLSRAVSAAVGDAFGWRAVYGLFAGLMVAMFLVLPGRLPVYGRKQTTLSYAGLLTSLGPILLRFRPLRLSCLLGAAVFCAFSAFWASVVFKLQAAPISLSLTAVGGFALLSDVAALASPLVGTLSDRLGATRVNLLSLAAAALGLGLAWLGANSFWALVAAGNLLAFALQSGQIANQTRIMNLDEGARSRLNTIYMVCNFAGGAFGTTAGLAAWGHEGWSAVCLVGAGPITLGLIVLAWSANRDSRPHYP